LQFSCRRCGFGFGGKPTGHGQFADFKNFRKFIVAAKAAATYFSGQQGQLFPYSIISFAGSKYLAKFAVNVLWLKGFLPVMDADKYENPQTNSFQNAAEINLI